MRSTRSQTEGGMATYVKEQEPIALARGTVARGTVARAEMETGRPVGYSDVR
jgi:hypothetical protein